MGTEDFVAHFIACDKTVQLVLHPHFTQDNWEGLTKYVGEQLGKGWLSYDIDMRRITYINSQMLGLLVAFNAHLGKLGGHLRIVVQEGSMIDQLFTISQLRKLMSVLAMRPQEAQR